MMMMITITIMILMMSGGKKMKNNSKRSNNVVFSHLKLGSGDEAKKTLQNDNEKRKEKMKQGPDMNEPHIVIPPQENVNIPLDKKTKRGRPKGPTKDRTNDSPEEKRKNREIKDTSSREAFFCILPFFFAIII
jgi:hypothetical protein